MMKLDSQRHYMKEVVASAKLVTLPISVSQATPDEKPNLYVNLIIKSHYSDGYTKLIDIKAYNTA